MLLSSQLSSEIQTSESLQGDSSAFQTLLDTFTLPSHLVSTLTSVMDIETSLPKLISAPISTRTQLTTSLLFPIMPSSSVQTRIFSTVPSQPVTTINTKMTVVSFESPEPTLMIPTPSLAVC